MHFVPLSPGRSWSTLPTAVWTRRCTAWWGPTGACLCWRATELCFDQTWTTWGAKLPYCREGGQDTNQHMEVGVEDIRQIHGLEVCFYLVLTPYFLSVCLQVMLVQACCRQPSQAECLRLRLLPASWLPFCPCTMQVMNTMALNC